MALYYIGAFMAVRALPSAFDRARSAEKDFDVLRHTGGSGDGPRILFVGGNPGVARFYAAAAQELADATRGDVAVLGLRGFVGGVDVGGGQVVDYATYVAPGLIAYTAFTTPFYEALYSAYVRMFYQKTWDGILATQVELPHLVWGEVLWAAARGFMNASVVAVVLAIFAAFGTVDVHLAWLPALPLLGLWAGLCFGAFALIFTALVPAIDHMNYPVFLIGVPLSLASNTYFPVSSDVAALQVLIELNPVYQLAESCRGLLVRGAPDAHLWKLFATSGGLLVLLTPLAVALTRRRVLS